MSRGYITRGFDRYFTAAAQAGNRALLKEWANVRDCDKRGPLHYAAKYGLTDACKYFLEALNLDINEKDCRNLTPLAFAAGHRQTATAKFLVDYGAALETDGRTALHLAANTGDIELMKCLLAKGAIVDFRNENSNTALVWATAHGQHDAAKLLLEHGADPNGHPDDECFAPLSEAITSNSLPCVKLLMEANADANRAAGGSNPLHLAAYYGSPEIVKTLLQNGADVNVKSILRCSDHDDWTRRKAIQVAAARGNVEAVKVLFPVTTPIEDYQEWSIGGILGDMAP